MPRNLSLVKNREETSTTQSLFIPRFPFGRLVFKGSKDQDCHAFEVCHLTPRGMHLQLKDGGHSYHSNEFLEGKIHLFDQEIEIIGDVVWVQGPHLGLEFRQENQHPDFYKKLFDYKTLLLGMRCLTDSELPYEIPVNLKYWLRSDGLIEIFIWDHRDGEVSKIQMIFLDNYLEWKDALGIRTAKILGKREHETPLNDQDELVLTFHDGFNEEIVRDASSIIKEIQENILPENIHNFIKRKLSLL